MLDTGKTDTEKLAWANSKHDELPSEVAEVLRSLDPSSLSVDQGSTFVFLANHVLGEKLSMWDEALKQQVRALQHPDATPGWLRQAAAAALAAGNDEMLDRYTSAYAIACGAPDAPARTVIRLTTTMYQASGLTATAAANATTDAMALLDHPFWRSPSKLDSSVAVCLNNLAGAIKDRPSPDLETPSLRAAVTRCAELAHAFWKRAGTWVNVERALYLRATVATALRDFESTRRFCADAFAVLDANDQDVTQPVDRAFLELELSHASKRLGLHEESAAAYTRAEKLAATFKDAGLNQWFDSRRTWLAGQAG
ncbi:MAG: hypothetical protein JO142_17240 [Burkholderiales bacterium]|nr:hypothetical protein [Burkholderiales bacterium]